MSLTNTQALGNGVGLAEDSAVQPEKESVIDSATEHTKESKIARNDPTHYLLPTPSRWQFLKTHPVFMPYFRWFTLAMLINIALAYKGLPLLEVLPPVEIISYLSYMVLGNFAVAILIRQHYVINLLFWLATRIPTSWPLKLRWSMGKVYHFGGWHSGCAVAGTLWFSVLMLSMLYLQAYQHLSFSAATLVISASILILLCAMLLTALPAIRARKHNQFERVHRFAGWSVLGLFWLQSFSLLSEQSPQQSAVELLRSEPSLWLLSLLSFSVLLPWLRLRKVALTIDKPSNHVAIANFDYGVTPFAGSSMALSRNPLLEWHSFANIPVPNKSGYRLAISRAGDWTGEFIEQAPPYIWVKGIPTAGVGNVDQLFKKVLWVATGSGIGPCLPHLLAGKVAASLVWSTRDPVKTYGDDLVNQIIACQDDVMIWDTDKKGKPDMVDITYQAFKRSGAEAVIVISNKKLTYSVVHGMESRGIPAFGAIWDS